MKYNYIQYFNKSIYWFVNFIGIKILYISSDLNFNNFLNELGGKKLIKITILIIGNSCLL